MNRHKLGGCLMTPLMSYLKTLGLLKIVSCKDSRAAACWEDDTFVIYAKLTKEDITEFILNEYSPTPIVAPWSYNKFKKTLNLINELPYERRFDPYKTTAKQIEKTLAKFANVLNAKSVDKTLVDTNKSLLLKMCRNTLPDSVVPWIDTIGVLAADKPSFAPVLGTGGNDGNFDIAENFLNKINAAVTSSDEETKKRWLESSLYGETAPLLKDTTLGHSPEGAGGPNSGMGFDGPPLSNPWDYIFAIEGTLLFAGSVSKHLSTNTGKAAFPFTASTSNVGYATASGEEKSADSRGEIWLPIWKNPATYKEIRHIFNEGRIQIGKKQAKTGTEFARAVMTLGTERGIQKFQRFCILQRKGRDYLAVDAGIMPVSDNESAAILLNEIDRWHNPIIKKSNEKGAARSLIQLVRNLDESIMDFSKAKEKKRPMLQILINIARLEKHMSGQRDYRPLQPLSPQWLSECYDNTPEFRLAASIASIKNIRENLEYVESRGGKIEQKIDSVHCVWNQNNSTIRNIKDVLYRRAVDGKIGSNDGIPIVGTIPAQLGDLLEFLHGGLDVQKMGDLILALSLINMDFASTRENTRAEIKEPRHRSKKGTEIDYPWDNVRNEMELLRLPEAYCIIKLIYPPDSGEGIPYDLSVLNYLNAGRLNDAYFKASRILQSHGLQPLRYSKKHGNPKGTSISDSIKERLMPSLLFTLSEESRKKLLLDVIAPNSS